MLQILPLLTVVRKQVSSPGTSQTLTGRHPNRRNARDLIAVILLLLLCSALVRRISSPARHRDNAAAAHQGEGTRGQATHASPNVILALACAATAKATAGIYVTGAMWNLSQNGPTAAL